MNVGRRWEEMVKGKRVRMSDLSHTINLCLMDHLNSNLSTFFKFFFDCQACLIPLIPIHPNNIFLDLIQCLGYIKIKN